MMPDTPRKSSDAASEMDALTAYVHAVRHALEDEARAAREDLSGSFEARDGRLVYESNEGCAYTFAVDVAPAVPEDTPVRVQVEGEWISGSLVAVHDFDVLALLSRSAGEIIPRAWIAAEPWFILEILRKRLDSCLESPHADADIPLTLFALRPAPSGEDSELAAAAEAALRALGARDLIPNEAQRLAMARSAGSRFHAVWGPPGTGKTATLAQVVRTLALAGERVMVLAHANAAVDVAVLRLARAFSGTPLLREGRILRVGPPQLKEARECPEVLPERILEHQHPDLFRSIRQLETRRRELSTRLRLARDRAELRRLGEELDQVRAELDTLRHRVQQLVAELIQQAQVVAATISRFAIEDVMWTWPADTIIVDETSMAPFPAIVAAAFQTKKRLHLFGDLRQLPPINRARTTLAERWLGRDAFEISGVRAAAAQGVAASPSVTLLDVQYRMAESIASVVSDFGYEGRLKTDPNASRTVRPVIEGPPFPGDEVVVVDTSLLEPACTREARASSYSRFNVVHGALAVTLAAAAARTGRSVGLITPYRAQARLMNVLASPMNEREQAVTAATVHRFQGSERDVVIVDLVDAPEETAPSHLTGRDPETAFRLLNVALSRARGKLVVVAHGDFVERRHPETSPARGAMRLLTQRGRWLRLESESCLPQLAGTGVHEVPGGALKWLAGWAEAQRELSGELRRASRSVVVGFPRAFPVSDELVEAVGEAAGRGVSTVVWCPLEIAQRLEDTAADLRLLGRGGGFFALLDRRVAYAGGLSALGPFVRAAGTEVVSVLQNLLLGSALAQPAPRAEVERAIAAIAGRCPDCGETRWPRRDIDGRWVLRCESLDHRGELLDRRMAEQLIQAAELKCPGCGGEATVGGEGGSLFVTYEHHDLACDVTALSLDQVFGGERGWHS